MRTVQSRRSLHRLYIQTSPQIPAGDAAIGLPAFCDFFHLQGFWHLALFVVLLNRHLDSEIAGRQYVWAPQRENQKHMRGPNSDAFYLRQVFNNFLVGHIRQASEVQLATNRPLRHVAQVRRFLFRKTDRSQLLVGEFVDAFGSYRFSGKRRKSVEDRCSSFAVQLLIHDSLSQTMKPRLAKFHAVGADLFDDGAQYRIRFL